MKLLFLKWFHRAMIRRDEARRRRLLTNWVTDRANLRRQYLRELNALQGAMSHHAEALTKIEQERLWQMVERRQHG